MLVNVVGAHEAAVVLLGGVVCRVGARGTNDAVLIVVGIQRQLLRTRARVAAIHEIGRLKVVAHPNYPVARLDEAAVEDGAVHDVVENDFFVVGA